MIDIREVAEKIYRIQVKIPEVFSAFTVYFVHEAKGVVIDPGPAYSIPSIQEAMRKIGIKELSYIIPTHIHMDHGGATGSLTRLFPAAKVIVHPLGAPHLIEPSRLIKGTKMSYGDDFEDLYGPILPVSKSRIKTPEDGQRISANGIELQINYAPGHAKDHITILDRKTMGLFCGEALGMRTKSARSSPLPNAAPPGFDMEAYIESINRLRELKPRLLFYAHDGVGRNPEELISRLSENTNTFGNIILGALRKGEAADFIDHKIQQYLSTHFSIDMKDLDTRTSVEGFIFYFKKKGIV